MLEQGGANKLSEDAKLADPLPPPAACLGAHELSRSDVNAGPYPPVSFRRLDRTTRFTRSSPPVMLGCGKFGTCSSAFLTMRKNGTGGGGKFILVTVLCTYSLKNGQQLKTAFAD